MIFLHNIAESRQNKGGDSTKGWALFGIFSCVYVNLIISIYTALISLINCIFQRVDYFLSVINAKHIVNGADSLSFQYYSAVVALFTRLEYKNR